MQDFSSQTDFYSIKRFASDLSFLATVMWSCPSWAIFISSFHSKLRLCFSAGLKPLSQCDVLIERKESPSQQFFSAVHSGLVRMWLFQTCKFILAGDKRTWCSRLQHHRCQAFKPKICDSDWWLSNTIYVRWGHFCQKDPECIWLSGHSTYWYIWGKNRVFYFI